LIRFYDFTEAFVKRRDIFKLPLVKFQKDIKDIIHLEEKWIGETVVARNNYTNVYELGRIKNRVGKGRQFTIEWSNGKQSIQNANHFFGRYNNKMHKNTKLETSQMIMINDYVLAPKETIFLPGRVIAINLNIARNSLLKIKFVDGTT
jgi:hypothetical protein